MQKPYLGTGPLNLTTFTSFCVITHNQPTNQTQTSLLYKPNINLILSKQIEGLQ